MSIICTRIRKKIKEKLKKKANRLKDEFAEGIENFASKGMDSANKLKDDLMESAHNILNDKA